MKTFQTKTASWVLKNGKWVITQYKGSQIQGAVELLPEDMAMMVEELLKMSKKENK
jgi:hypothetical protein